MTTFDPTFHSHRRYNPLTNEYILVSPHRTKRPWLGQTETVQSVDLPSYDPNCYLCPGNDRSTGERNPTYEHTHTFRNDFAAVLPDPLPAVPSIQHPLMAVEPVQGDCDVVIYHPRHDLTLARMSLEEIEKVLEEWIRIYKVRGSQKGIKYIQIFENKGAMMGCSNPHPHGQVWSSSSIPTIPAAELQALRNYSIHNQSSETLAPKGPEGKPCLICDYAFAEIQIAHENGRVVDKNEDWVAVVPWWATWPFEILLMPYKRHIPSIIDLNASEKATFADILLKISRRYDNLFTCSFAYSMGIHQRPIPSSGSAVGQDIDDVAHLHLHFNPPLLRSATVKKFLVGYELMAEAQRDLSPEQASEKLRATPSHSHYKEFLA